MGVGKGNVQVVNVYFLAMFQWPWDQGSRCQEGTNPTRGPRGSFPYELNFPQHRTERGRGSRFQYCNNSRNIWIIQTSRAHVFAVGGGSCDGGGTGCPNCLKRFVARMSPFLRLAPTVPAGSRVARKYDPLLLLRGNVRLAPIICVPDASDTIRCV